MVMMQMLLGKEVNYDGHVCTLKAPCTQPGVVYMMAKLMLKKKKLPLSNSEPNQNDISGQIRKN